MDLRSSTDASAGNQQLWDDARSDAVAYSPINAMCYHPDQLDAASGGPTTVVDNWLIQTPFNASEDCESESPDLSANDTPSRFPLPHSFFGSMDRDFSTDCHQAHSCHLSGLQRKIPFPPESSLLPASISPTVLGALSASPARPVCGEVLLQRPYTSRRQSHQVGLRGESIKFSVRGQLGFMLKDAREKNYCGLDDRDEEMFIDGGPCVSIRLEIINCRSWSRQIRTMDWRKPRRPITKAKLTTEIAKVMDIFFRKIQEGGRGSDTNTDRLVLTTLNRVSKSSWQPELLILN